MKNEIFTPVKPRIYALLLVDALHRREQQNRILQRFVKLCKPPFCYVFCDSQFYSVLQNHARKRQFVVEIVVRFVV